MKKALSFIFIIAILAFLMQFSLTLLKKEHEVSYHLLLNEKDVLVDEIYKKNETDDYYRISIQLDQHRFDFTVDNDFNKQKEIVKDLMIYDKDNVFCVYPIYLNEKTGEDVLCDVGGVNYSYFAIKDRYPLGEYIKSLPNFSVLDKNSNSSVTFADTDVYQANFLENEHVYIYNYQSLIDANNSLMDSIIFSNSDIYKNQYGVWIGEKFIFPEDQKLRHFKRFKIVNLRNKKAEYIDLEETLSDQFYINGVIENQIYFFDRSNKKQYRMDVEKKEVEVIGTEKKKGLVYQNGAFREISVYDLDKEDVLFTENFDEIKDYSYTFAEKTSKYYYFYTKDGKMYRAIVGIKNQKPMLLFEKAGIDNFQIKEDGIYFLEGTKLYRYTQNNLSLLLERNEFAYNNYHIYDVYFE